MKPIRYHLHIHREALKFSAAHMTVFPDGTKERIHGHNYQMQLVVEVTSIAFRDTIAFASFKSVLKDIAETWDERLLLGTKNPYFRMRKKSKREIDFELCKCRYVIPADEVVLLPLENITVETLSSHILHTLRGALSKKFFDQGLIRSLTVRVDQAPGLGGSTTWANDP